MPTMKKPPATSPGTPLVLGGRLTKRGTGKSIPSEYAYTKSQRAVNSMIPVVEKALFYYVVLVMPVAVAILSLSSMYLAGWLFVSSFVVGNVIALLTSCCGVVNSDYGSKTLAILWTMALLAIGLTIAYNS